MTRSPPVAVRRRGGFDGVGRGRAAAARLHPAGVEEVVVAWLEEHVHLDAALRARRVQRHLAIISMSISIITNKMINDVTINSIAIVITMIMNSIIINSIIMLAAPGPRPPGGPGACGTERYTYPPINIYCI